MKLLTFEIRFYYYYCSLLKMIIIQQERETLTIEKEQRH